MRDKADLTPVELELMTILWTLGQGTVRDVMMHLPKNRLLAYTSVSTILRILQEKKILGAKKANKTDKTEKSSKPHIYYPLISKEHYSRYSLRKMLNQVFSGNSLNLVSHLVNSDALSLKEIAEIEKLLKSKKKELNQ